MDLDTFTGIRVLKQLGPFLRILSAYDHDHFRDKNWRTILASGLYAFGIAAFMIISFIWVVLIVWYLLENILVFEKLAVGVPLLITLVQSVNTFVAMMLKHHAIAEAINQLQRAIDRRCMTSKQSHRLYAATERKYASLTNRITKMAFAALVAMLSLSAMFPISYAIFGKPSPQDWLLPVEMHSLMHRNNATGFFVDWFIELCAGSGCLMAIVLSGLLSIGICLYINRMVNDLESMLYIDDSVTESSGSASERLEWWSIYVRTIRFHIEIIGVAVSFFNSMGVILFNMTLACTIIIAFNLFVIEMNADFSYEMLMALIDLYFFVPLTFTYFYLSERITTDLLAIGDIFYNSPWYNRLIVKQQKLVVLAIQRAQREVRLTGLGIFDCSLPIFGAVCNVSQIMRSASSYYLMIRSFR